MNRPSSHPAPTSAAKAGWLIGLLLAGWLAFLLWPMPQSGPAKISSVAAPPPSKLRETGLTDNPDWQGLPEFFAIWAKRGEWQGGRTRFAYWHPVMKTWSYYFEAVRAEGRFCFKEIAEPHDPEHYWDESLGEDCPIRFYRSVPSVPAVVLPLPAPAIGPVGNDRIEVKPEIVVPEIRRPGLIPIPVDPAPKS